MRHFTTPKNGEMFEFESMTEVVNYIDANQFRREGGKSFVGEDLPTWSHVEARTTRDWAEGMHILNEFVTKLRDAEIPELKDHRRRTKFDEFEGDEIDYERLMSGQAMWRKSDREEQAGPTTVTIVIDTTTPASKDSRDILWRGAGAIALTQILEEKGFSVELWIVNGSKLYRGKETRVMTACRLKEGSDPLDASTLINTVAGWYYRTVTFALLRTMLENQNEQEELGLGYCTPPTQDDLDLVTRDVLRVYTSGVFSFDGALSQIVHEVNAINEVVKRGGATD